MIDKDRFVHYMVGVPKIDADHFELLLLCAADIVSFIKRNKYNEAANLLKLLCIKLEEHFAEEEEFMRTIGFKYIEAHILTHKDLLHKIISIEFSSITSDIHVDRFVDMFETLLIDHIDRYDIQFSEVAKQFENTTTTHNV